jgi:hypothetical protein
MEVGAEVVEATEEDEEEEKKEKKEKEKEGNKIGVAEKSFHYCHVGSTIGHALWIRSEHDSFGNTESK